VEQGNFTESSGEAAALRLLENAGSPQPDAVLASNDLMALGVLRALRAKGLKVPEDISVVGFDDLQAELADPPLTTVRQPVYEMGCRAAEILLAEVRGQKVRPEQMFAPELVVRASCVPSSPVLTEHRCAQSWGVNALLERAYPSPRSMFAALCDEMVAPQDGPARPDRRIERLVKLGDWLKLADCRERGLLAALQQTRSYGVQQVEQGLSGRSPGAETTAWLAERLPPLGIDALAIARLKEAGNFRGPSQLVLDCGPGGEEPAAGRDTWLSPGQIIAEHARRADSALRIVKPLLDGGRPVGFLLVSGALLDDAVLTRLGELLSRVWLRSDGE
jgi:hypothetical protein